VKFAIQRTDNHVGNLALTLYTDSTHYFAILNNHLHVKNKCTMR